MFGVGVNMIEFVWGVGGIGYGNGFNFYYNNLIDEFYV